MVTFLHQPPEYCVYSSVPPCLASSIIFHAHKIVLYLKCSIHYLLLLLECPAMCLDHLLLQLFPDIFHILNSCSLSLYHSWSDEVHFVLCSGNVWPSTGEEGSTYQAYMLKVTQSHFPRSYQLPVFLQLRVGFRLTTPLYMGLYLACTHTGFLHAEDIVAFLSATTFAFAFFHHLFYNNPWALRSWGAIYVSCLVFSISLCLCISILPRMCLFVYYCLFQLEASLIRIEICNILCI